ncbi:MAG: hypothetical protein L6Q95_08575 [Planctomycetes bacterium]|nr:hypothetical protein [Planctomycetota bacterium]
MRRAVLLAVPVAAALAVGGILLLRRAHDEERNDMARVCGTVTGRYGTVWNVRITAESGGRVLAETWTSVNGYYAIDVPAAIRIDLCALPIPETYLVPERRPLALRPGERRVEPFDLRTIRATEGILQGGGPEPAVGLRAVREDAEGPGQSRSAAVNGTRFVFFGLESDVPYRLEVSALGWALEQPVAFRGGDAGVVVPLRRLLSLDLTVLEVGTGEPIGSFTTKVVKPDGEVFASVEGRNGRLAWQASHPDPANPDGWTLLVGAEGHLEKRCPRTDCGVVFLERLLAPEDARSDMATVTGTVTGRYGTVWNVRITAEAGGRVLAETWTSVNGRYAIDVPAAVRIDLCALPIPETYLVPERRPLALRPGERRVEPFDLRTAFEGAVPAPTTGK